MIVDHKFMPGGNRWSYMEIQKISVHILLQAADCKIEPSPWKETQDFHFHVMYR